MDAEISNGTEPRKARKLVRVCRAAANLRPMTLQSLPKLFPGADLRVRVASRRRLCFVTIRHEGRVGNGVHRELAIATATAALNMRPN